MAKKISFEDALEKLDVIVKKMESGELSLDDLIKNFEEGVGLVSKCHQKLNEAEKKIELLTNLSDQDKNIDSGEKTGGTNGF